jgi:hypothetical protein
LGQRLFFLHNGRETDLLKVIAAHASPGNSKFPPSEANPVVEAFSDLSASDKQAILNFLRSLWQVRVSHEAQCGPTRGTRFSLRRIGQVEFCGPRPLQI